MVLVSVSQEASFSALAASVDKVDLVHIGVRK